MLFKKSNLVIAASLFAIGAAHAAPPSATANLSVNINVTSATDATSCSLVSFAGGVGAVVGNASYASGATAAEVTQTSNFSVSCNGTNAIPFSIEAGAGNNASATSRRALFSGNYVNYQLLVGVTPLSSIWDAATPAFGGVAMTGSTTPAGGNSSANQLFSVNVPANQTAPTGTYTDVVLLTATF